jgi:hypothetical protein
MSSEPSGLETLELNGVATVAPDEAPPSRKVPGGVARRESWRGSRPASPG